MTTNGLKGYQNVIKSTSSSAVYNPSSSINTAPLTDKYTVGEDIGRGKFAVVRKCTNTETGEVVAGKFIRKRRRGKSCREEILREVVMLEMALDHPRLVNLKEVYETQQELVLITEYCAGGELFTECILEEKFNESDVRNLMAQIVEGLVYLHERKIVHLDLKPQNILLTEEFPNGTVKICDLGFACLVNEEEDIRDIIGTPDYVAPEVLNYDPLSLYTDMWSLGVLTYVMLTTCSPFAGDDKQETFCNITTVNLDFPDDLFANISDDAVDFIKKLLLAEPSERMTAKECLQHPWLADLFPSANDSMLTPGLKGLGFESKLMQEWADPASNSGRDKVENQSSEMSVSETKEDGFESVVSDDDSCLHNCPSDVDTAVSTVHVNNSDVVTPDSGIEDTFENRLNEINSAETTASSVTPQQKQDVDDEAIVDKCEANDSIEERHEINPENSNLSNPENFNQSFEDENEIEDEDMLSVSGLTDNDNVESLHKTKVSADITITVSNEADNLGEIVEHTPADDGLAKEISSSIENPEDYHSTMEHSGISEVDDNERDYSVKVSSDDNSQSGSDFPSAIVEHQKTVTRRTSRENIFSVVGRQSFGGFSKREEGDHSQQAGFKGRHSTGTVDGGGNNLHHSDKHKLSDERLSMGGGDKSEKMMGEEYEFVPVSKRVRSYEDSLSPKSPKIPRSPMVNRHNRHKPH